MLYSVTFFASTLGSNPMAIAFGMLLFAIFEFAIYLVQRVTHFSLFRLVDIPRFLSICNQESLDLAVVLPMLGASALALVASVVAFERRVP